MVKHTNATRNVTLHVAPAEAAMLAKAHANGLRRGRFVELALSFVIAELKAGRKPANPPAAQSYLRTKLCVHAHSEITQAYAAAITAAQLAGWSVDELAAVQRAAFVHASAAGAMLTAFHVNTKGAAHA